MLIRERPENGQRNEQNIWYKTDGTSPVECIDDILTLNTHVNKAHKTSSVIQ